MSSLAFPIITFSCPISLFLLSSYVIILPSLLFSSSSAPLLFYKLFHSLPFYSYNSTTLLAYSFFVLASYAFSLSLSAVYNYSIFKSLSIYRSFSMRDCYICDFYNANEVWSSSILDFIFIIYVYFNCRLLLFNSFLS